jgi:hypothetical protein
MSYLPTKKVTSSWFKLRGSAWHVFGFLLALLIPLSLNALATDAVGARSCQRVAMTFLARPTKHTLTTLVGDDITQCWDVIGSSNSNLQRLTHSVEKGNQWAAQYLAGNLKSLDGGNLEDSLIALGQFSEHNMEFFLMFASNGKLSKHEFTDALTMLPLSFSDNANAQLHALKVRRDKIMHVNRSDLQVQKSLAFKAIDDFMAQIRATTPPAANDGTLH